MALTVRSENGKDVFVLSGIEYMTFALPPFEYVTFVRTSWGIVPTDVEIGGAALLALSQ
jgi:hypothetical protein